MELPNCDPLEEGADGADMVKNARAAVQMRSELAPWMQFCIMDLGFKSWAEVTI